MLLDGAPFKAISERRDDWKSQDYYRCPGPLQFSTGDMDIPLTLKYELIPWRHRPGPSCPCQRSRAAVQAFRHSNSVRKPPPPSDS